MKTKKNIKRLLLGIAVSATAAFALIASGCSATDKVEVFFNQLTCEHKTTKIVTAVAPTCTEDGHAEYKECVDCDKAVVEKVVIKSTGHTLEIIPGYKASCTTAGLTDGAYCTVCEEMVTMQEKIPALGHSRVSVDNIAATCTNVGYIGATVCENGCGAVYQCRETIEVNPYAHKFVNHACIYCGNLEVINFADVKVGDDLTGYAIRLSAGEFSLLPYCSWTENGYVFTSATASVDSLLLGSGNSAWGIECADTLILKIDGSGIYCYNADNGSIEYDLIVDWSGGGSDDFTVEVKDYVWRNLGGVTSVNFSLLEGIDLFEFYYVGEPVTAET